jgi:hypothetical protein
MLVRRSPGPSFQRAEVDSLHLVDHSHQVARSLQADRSHPVAIREVRNLRAVSQGGRSLQVVSRTLLVPAAVHWP